MKKTALITALVLVLVLLVGVLPSSAAEPVKVGIGDTGITYTGNWSTVGETKRSSAANEYCEYTFEGTGVEIWFGRGAGAGIAEIFIDNLSYGEVDMYKASAATEKMFEKLDLENGSHTVKIVNTGKKSGSNTNVNLAYFMIYAPEPESPYISTKIPSGSSDIIYNGTWSLVGETMRSTAEGQYCEYSFKGTGVELWIGRGPGAGIAEIFIDGVSQGEVDMYKDSPATEKMFEKLDLEYGNHTVKMVNTGKKSGSATNINLAYFNIYTPKDLRLFDKVASADTNIAYNGSWSLVGETMRSSAANEYCEYTFAGRGIEIYYGMGTGAGISEVFIDGVSKGTVDAYSATVKTDKLFSITDLTEGVHTVKVVNTGNKNDAGVATNVNIAYFNVELGEKMYFINMPEGGYVSDGSADIFVRIGGSAAEIERVTFNGTELENAGSEFTITTDMLADLANDVYIISVKTSDGICPANLTLEVPQEPEEPDVPEEPEEPEEPKPETGDLTAALLIVSAVAMIGTAIVCTKRSRAK